ncbi:MAG: GTP 3',8-cyclase MoaA [Candidatus Sumerlaeaceae bacterium]|nr:GTP 3',8-cyclase MoaA [Candidatus Sumerlaeaceae bacterium]
MTLVQLVKEAQSHSAQAGGTLVDAFGRRITYLRVSVTDRCNLRCSYCMPAGRPKWFEREKLLSLEEIVRIVRVAVALGIQKVRITGGEPLVRNDVPQLIAQLREVVDLRELVMTTNGTLLERHARELKDAGLDRLNVSLDSLRPERFAKITGSNVLTQVWAGLEKALEVGFAPIKINMVVIKGVNDDEVVDFARLTRCYPFHVRFIEYMPIGANREDWEQAKVVPADEIKARIAATFPLERISPETEAPGPERTFVLCESKGCIGFISPVSDEFCAKCNRIRLTSDGKLRGCLMRNGEVDLFSALRAGASDEEIQRLILTAVRRKPEKHTINSSDFAYSDFYTMNRLGG